MPLFETDAIVLKQYEFGEADKIVVFYSKEKGKFSAIAKGIRKTKSFLAASLQPFSYVELLVYQGNSDLGKVSQVDIKQSFSKLRDDIIKMGYTSYVAELINELTIERKSDKDIFNLLLLTLRLLEDIDDLDLVVRAFELKLLKILGYQPYLKNCVECGKDLKQNFRFSSQAGGIVCSKCAGKWSKRISLGTIKFMERLLNQDYKRILRLNLPRYANEELVKIMPDYIQHLINKRLKSLTFLKSLKDFS